MPQQNLFSDIPIQPNEKLKLTCRTCLYKYKHEYGKMLYCSKAFDKKTAYGNKKIKAGNKACHLYKKEEK